jgi:protein CpxP
MKLLKCFIATLTLALSLAAAQHTPKSPVQRMVDQLDLSADQKAKIDPILEDDAKQVRALRGSTAADGPQRKADIRKATDAKIKPILTDEQWKKLEQLRQDDKKESKKKK